MNSQAAASESPYVSSVYYPVSEAKWVAHSNVFHPCPLVSDAARTSSCPGAPPLPSLVVEQITFWPQSSSSRLVTAVGRQLLSPGNIRNLELEIDGLTEMQPNL